MSVKSKLKKAVTSMILLLKKKEVVPVYIEKNKEDLLANKTALIIGGSGGIGFGIAEKLNKSGCNIILAGTNIKKLEDNCKNLIRSKYVVWDLNNISSFDSVLSQADKLFNGIDILVCSSGTHTDYPGFDWDKVTEDDYDKVMNVNLKGTYFTMQKFAKYLIGRKLGGHILVISSSRGLQGSWAPYRLSKLGINGVVRGFAEKLAPYGIIVNGIGPGPTATAMQGTSSNENIYTSENVIGRMMTVEEIAEMSLFLVSDLGNSIIGDVVYMSAGHGIIDS